MTARSAGYSLITDLLDRPEEFHEQGRAYDLLQEYFAGLPVGTLRPLVRHENELVRRAAIWILSELGAGASSLLDEVVPLITSRDRYLAYHALEIAIVCAIGERVDRFAAITRGLEHDDEVIRVLTMRLLSNADQTQLEAGHVQAATSGLAEAHRLGLERLSRQTSLEPDAVTGMLAAGDPLLRRYGAIAARRLMGRFPELMAAAAASPDADVGRFARES
jgi:hypothetical protein